MPQVEANIRVFDQLDGRVIELDINRDLNGALTLKQFEETLKNTLLSISSYILREEQARGFDKNPVVITDGRVGKSPLDVQPYGKIEFVSTQVSGLEVIEEIYSGILSRSKVVTGTYYEGNIVFLNSKVVAINRAELKQWIASNPILNPGDAIRFVNVLPYARKLERHGVTAQRSRSRSVKSKDKEGRSGERILAPNGVYYLTSRAALGKFKGNLQIYFGFVLGSTLGVQGLVSSTKDGKPLRRTYKPSPKRPKNSGPYLYPYIKLIFNQRGTS